MGSETLRRVYLIELRALNVDGRPCEVCEEHMHNHIWADLEVNGFVVNCSIAELGEAGKARAS